MRRALAALAMATAVAALPQIAVGLLVWSLVAAPLTATAGQLATFTMTATNVAGPDDLGCLEVTLPATFTIQSVGDPVASNGDDWRATATGTNVVVRSLSGGGRLNIGESVTFQIMAVPSSAGVTSWPNHAHRQEDCKGLNEVGLPITVTVLPALLPTPMPTLVPTATPRPTPTARPIPSLPVSLPPPSLAPVASSAPTARPTTSPSGRPRPSASGDASPTAVPAGPLVAPPPSAGGGVGHGVSAAPAPQIAPERVPIRLGGGSLSVLDGFGTWSVPAAVVGVPGLLVVLWVTLQTVGALAWIPAVRRLRGDDRRRES